MNMWLNLKKYLYLISLSLLILVNSCTRKSNDLKCYGYVEIRETELSFRIGGNISAILVQPGDKVTTGDSLAFLDSTPYKLNVEMRTAEYTSAQAKLDQLETGLRPQEIHRSYSALQLAQAKYQQAVEDFQRVEDLWKNGDLSLQDYQQAQTNLEIVKSQMNIARQDFSLASEGFPPQEIQAALANVERAEKSLNLAKLELSYTILTSPGDGIITSVYAEPGENIGAGIPVMATSRMDTVKVNFWVSGQDLRWIYLNKQVQIYSDPGEKLSGTISYISTQAEFTPSMIVTEQERTTLVYLVQATVENKDQLLKPGLPVTVEIPRSEID